jgi:hypothetical protein
MTLAITINLILSAVVFAAIVGALTAAIRPSRRIAAPTPTSARAMSNNRTSRQAKRHPAGGLA